MSKNKNRSLAQKARTKARNENIRDYYARLCTKQKDGILIYSHDYMMKLLSEKYFLAQKTIEDIIKERDLVSVQK